jgi:hypothetical protein
MVRRVRRPKPKKVSKLRKVVLQTRVAPGADYERVLAMALELPGVEESTSYGTPSLKVKGKFISRLRTEAEGALALRCDFLDRQILLQASPGTFFVTDHYLNYPMILVRLDKVRRGELKDLIVRAWRMVAPPKLVAEYEAATRQIVTSNDDERDLPPERPKRPRRRPQRKRKKADIPPS